MTYGQFVLLFLVLPILGLAWRMRPHLTRRHVGLIALMATVALVYTTPWDNYLVATRVWWYDPALVSGIALGYVPIEEYAFFVLQTALTGLWLFALIRLRPLDERALQPRPAMRWRVVLVGVVVWAVSVWPLLSGWQPGTYLALILGWALPPILLQLGYGVDILWHHRRTVALGLLPPIVYLSAADALAIGFGTWTISPEQSLTIYLGGVLPVEEFIFFVVTNTLIVFGLTLLRSQASARRVPTWAALRRLASPAMREGDAA